MGNIKTARIDKKKGDSNLHIMQGGYLTLTLSVPILNTYRRLKVTTHP